MLAKTALSALAGLLITGSAWAQLSTFDGGGEGWTIATIDPGYPVTNHNWTSPATWDQSFGHPAPCLRIGDEAPWTFIAAPAKFLGYKLGAFGKNVEYDLFLRYTDNETYPCIVLCGAGMTLYHNIPAPTLNQWNHIVVPLRGSADWRVNSAWYGRNATDSDLAAALYDLEGFYIMTEWMTGPDNTNVDNVLLQDFEVFRPDGLLIVEGEEYGGDIGSLFWSDDNRYQVFNDPEALRVTLELHGHMPYLELSKNFLIAENSVDRLGLAVAIRAYNFIQNKWVTVGGAVGTTADTFHVGAIVTNPLEFRDSLGNVMARVTWGPINDEAPAQDGWLHNLDLFAWVPG